MSGPGWEVIRWNASAYADKCKVQASKRTHDKDQDDSFSWHERAMKSCRADRWGVNVTEVLTLSAFTAIALKLVCLCHLNHLCCVYYCISNLQLDKCLKQFDDPDIWKLVLDSCLNAHANRRRAFVLDFTDAIIHSKHLHTTTIALDCRSQHVKVTVH